MTKLTHGQLFAGIGGFGLAAEWAGITNIWANEIDPFCCKVLRKNFPGLEVIEDDIRKLKGIAPNDKNNGGKLQKQANCFNPQGFREHKGKGRNEVWSDVNRCSKNELESYELKKVDIITGGFPCQPFSHAGKRKGKDDNRYLWPEMLRVIREVSPSWVIGENVAGLQSMENGRTLNKILSDLEDIGYQVETFSIPACSVGAWHRRDRIWIVATSHTNPLNDGSCKTEKYKHGEGAKWGRTEFPDQQECNPSEVCGDVSDNFSKRLEGMESGPQSGRYQRSVGLQSGKGKRGQRGNIEPRLGGMVNGLPDWVDGYWNAEPEGIPRTTDKKENRVNRLKAMGNAIVPQVAYQILKLIYDYEQQHKLT